MRARTMPVNGERWTWPPTHTHRPADGPFTTCQRCALDGAAPELYAALHDLVIEHDRFGGVPDSSPAWGPAHDALAAVKVPR